MTSITKEKGTSSRKRGSEKIRRRRETDRRKKAEVEKAPSWEAGGTLRLLFAKSGGKGEKTWRAFIRGRVIRGVNNWQSSGGGDTLGRGVTKRTKAEKGVGWTRVPRKRCETTLKNK